jgi:hypothetical protein
LERTTNWTRVLPKNISDGISFSIAPLKQATQMPGAKMESDQSIAGLEKARFSDTKRLAIREPAFALFIISGTGWFIV